MCRVAQFNDLRQPNRLLIFVPILWHFHDYSVRKSVFTFDIGFVAAHVS
jgi:hypothetical protein